MQEIKFIDKPNKDVNKQYNRYEPVMGNDYILIDWSLGNTCNYSCTYCHPSVYGGSIPWPDVDVAFAFVKRATDHYRSIGKNKIVWNLLGGEPTVWPKFRDFFSKVKEYDPDCIIRVLTNGSRTTNWWKKNTHLFDEVIISWHPERADYVHCSEVLEILQKEGVMTSVQVCMYPPLSQHCLDAAKYFYENAYTTNISMKSLQENIHLDRTFEYEQEFLKEIKQYEGQPKRMDPELRNSTDFEHALNKMKLNRPAYGKLMRFVNTETGESELFHPNDAMSSGRNSWKGWMCNIGIEALSIDENGIVSSGSSCFSNLSHGNMRDPENIEFPTSGRICEFDWCGCIADCENTKYRVE